MRPLGFRHCRLRWQRSCASLGHARLYAHLLRLCIRIEDFRYGRHIFVAPTLRFCMCRVATQMEGSSIQLRRPCGAAVLLVGFAPDVGRSGFHRLPPESGRKTRKELLLHRAESFGFRQQFRNARYTRSCDRVLSGDNSRCGMARWVMPTKTMSFSGSAQNQVPWAPAHS